MKYYVIYVVNNSLQLGDGKVTEWSDLASAKAKFHSVCQTLWNEKTVLTATVKILDTQLDTVEGYKEFISHVEPEPNAE